MANWIMSLKVMRMRILCRKVEETVLYMKEMMYEGLGHLMQSIRMHQKGRRRQMQRRFLLKRYWVVDKIMMYYSGYSTSPSLLFFSLPSVQDPVSNLGCF